MMTDKEIKEAQIAALKEILTDPKAIERWSRELDMYSTLVVKYMRGVLCLVHRVHADISGVSYDAITRLTHAEAKSLVKQHSIVHSFVELEG